VVFYVLFSELYHVQASDTISRYVFAKGMRLYMLDYITLDFILLGILMMKNY
jgi:hypothetical protein